MRPQLPEATDDLKACRDEPVPAIPGEPGTPLLKDQVSGVIGEQRTSALAKDKCAKNWSAFFKDVKDKLESGK